MSPSIRTFRNTDITQLCKVWNAHFGDLGIACQIDELRFELSSLSKPYFRAEELLIAELDEQVVGFLHIGSVGNADMSAANPELVSIAALCIVPCDSEKAIAKSLLSRAEQVAVERGAKKCLYRPMLPDAAFYLGFGPADFMIGATSSEQRCRAWAQAAGYMAQIPTTQWELDLSQFQPPIDRMQLQIRRSGHVDRQVDEPQLPWWQACLLGHTEPTSFQLSARSDRRLLSDALFWSVAGELQTVPLSLLWLWPASVPEQEQGADQLTFLLGESCRQWQAERVDLVRTVSVAGDAKLNAILRRLGFRDEQSGMVYEKQIA